MRTLYQLRGWLLLLPILLLTSTVEAKKGKTIKVLQFNIWQEGTVVPNGYEAIADEIVRTNADFVALSEVRNYKDTRFCNRIVESLRKRGKTYYSFYSYDSGIISRYPIIDSATVFPEKDDHGSIYKAVADMGSHKVALYTAHLDYRNCALYLPRGYCGTTWDKLPKKVDNLDTVLFDNAASQRSAAIRLFIEDAQKEIAKGHLVMLGGDFNEPSHLDWIMANRNLYDHNGLVVPWLVTSLLEKSGYKDAYRQRYPNPVTHPGFTFPADNPLVDIKKLAWSPEADDRDRIDFIFYHPFKGLQLKDAVIVGPKGSICRNMRIVETSKDRFTTPMNVWPTDHKAVLATFILAQ
jgi:endonuclease/exonuclease/phosphatase family metal-dependent hydrolase